MSCLGDASVTGVSLPPWSWPPPWQEVETSWRKLKRWGWESPTPTGHLCWHAPSGQGPPAPSAGGKVHRGQRSSRIIRSEDLWDRGPGTGLRVGWGGPGSSPSIRGGRQGPGSPGRSHPARPRPCGRVRVRAPRLVPGPCRLCPVLCLRALPPTLALSLEGSTAPPLPRGASPVGLLGVEVHASSEAHHHPEEGVSLWGRGWSRGELGAQTLEPGGLGWNPSSVTLLKWPGLSERQFLSL